MCNQFHVPKLTTIKKYLQQDLQLPLITPASSPVFARDAFPQSQVPVLLYADHQLQLVNKGWGYPTFKQKVVFNARVERFFSSRPSMWDESFAKRRCIIICDHFDESGRNWLPTDKGKRRKERFSLRNAQTPLTLIAGIYEKDHFALVTTQPNQTMRAIHNRMPLILEASEIRHYLFQNFTDLINRQEIKLSYSRKK